MDFYCSICKEPYDFGDRAPMVLPCGHTFCNECLNRIQNQKCPDCRKVFQKDRLPRNFELLSPLRDKKYFCSKHPNVPAAVFCLNDKQVICWDCKNVGEHNKHQYKLINDVLNEYHRIAQEESLNAEIEKVNQLLALFDTRLYIEQPLVKVEREIIQYVEKFFTSAMNGLMQQKEEITRRLYAFFAKASQLLQKTYQDSPVWHGTVKFLEDYCASLTELKGYKNLANLKELDEKLSKHRRLATMKPHLQTQNYSFIKNPDITIHYFQKQLSLCWKKNQKFALSISEAGLSAAPIFENGLLNVNLWKNDCTDDCKGQSCQAILKEYLFPRQKSFRTENSSLRNVLDWEKPALKERFVVEDLVLDTSPFEHMRDLYWVSPLRDLLADSLARRDKANACAIF